MTITTSPREAEITAQAGTMRAAVFHGADDIRVEDVPRPTPGPGRRSSASR